MSESRLRIGVLAPEVLGTYGDGGNATVLAQRARWRGIEAEIVSVPLGDPIPSELDIYALGGGEDTAQALAADYLRSQSGLARAAASGKPILAICASLQLLGLSYTDAAGTRIEGLGLLDLETFPGKTRAIGEIVTRPLLPGLTQPLTGFENHGGRTKLGLAALPLGKVLSGTGNGFDEVEGATQGSIIATYMHGPILARNPQLADLLLERALGETLSPLVVPSVDLLREERIAAAGIKDF